MEREACTLKDLRRTTCLTTCLVRVDTEKTPAGRSAFSRFGALRDDPTHAPHQNDSTV